MNIVFLYMLLVIAVFAGLIFLIQFALNAEDKVCDEMFAETMDKLSEAGSPEQYVINKLAGKS